MAVAGRTTHDRMPVRPLACAQKGQDVSRCAQVEKAGTHVEAPKRGGLDYMKEDSVTVGRAGRLSVHTLSERALGMRETECPPSCMHRAYRPRRVVP